MPTFTAYLPITLLSWISVLRVCYCRYHICDKVVKPLTKRDLCSWVELVATGAQQPIWFISHAWATAFQETLEMLDWHATVHNLPSSTGYWFCTLANVSSCWLYALQLSHGLPSDICIISYEWLSFSLYSSSTDPLVPSCHLKVLSFHTASCPCVHYTVRLVLSVSNCRISTLSA